MGTHPARGRPRSTSADEAILSATMESVARSGFHAATTAAIAARACVGKDTIYRRWTTKLDLVLAALDRHAGDPLELPDSGVLGLDLREYLRGLTGLLGATQAGAVIAALVGEGPQDPRTAGWLARFWQRRIDDLRSMMDRAVARGELVAGHGAEHLPELLVGAVAARWLFRHAPYSDQEVDGLVQAVLEGRLDSPAGW